MRWSLPLAVVLAVLALRPAVAEEAGSVEIARDGRALACLVLAPGAHALEKEAAEDLRWAVSEATGAALQILEGGVAPDGLVHVWIGPKALPARAEEALSSALKELPYDGAVIRRMSGGLVIAGPTPAGTSSGVATALLEDLGVRMYYPEALFTVVPRAARAAIRERVLRPSFEYRIWSGLSGREARPYARRNRLTDSAVPVPRFGFGHNLASVISAAAHGKDHPEYFPLRDGVRLIKGDHSGDTPQPCFTNPDVLRLTVEAARRFFDAHPDRDTFSLCVNDNPWYCECASCAALDQPYRDLPVGRQHSESYFEYVSQVAGAVAESHPGRFLGVYAYWNVEQPSRRRARLPDNVLVALTLDILQHHDSAYREKDRALVRAWADCAKNLHAYVYYGLGWFTPRTSPRLVSEELRFAAAHGVRAIYCEAYPFWGWCGPMHYVAARAQWDVACDPSRLLEELHADCFGEAAAEVRAFHEACERYWLRPRPGRWFEGLDNLDREEAMADTALLREARGHLEAAIEKAKGAKDSKDAKDPKDPKDLKVRERILWLKKSFDFTAAVGEAFEAKRDAHAARGDPAARGGAAAPAAGGARRLEEARKSVGEAHGRLLSEPAYRHTYYESGERFERKRDRWFSRAAQEVEGAGK
ncbi:MAG: DUF4838 domain-containing protein [Planctomycetes bacterium]|nr:DUF4838 domain-containing protein [Planctomycetota bacterium]